jgi:hypothetical protein
MEHHTLAAVSIAGTCLDVVGSLYLAYDLLGGKHGPLRLLTRAVTYSLVFGVGYGLGLGLIFGVASGVTTGITISIELNRTARGQDHYSLPWEGVFAAIRGFGFGLGLYNVVGLGFATSFAILLTVGQIFAYSRGMRPALDYSSSRRPRLSRRQFWGTVVRTVGYIASALACSAFIHHVEHPGLLRFAWVWWPASSPPSELPSIPTLNTMQTIFLNAGLGLSASCSSFADSLCNPSSIGSHSLTRV